VPNRACTKDEQCGDGFCDRGRCAPMSTRSPYGRRCEVLPTIHQCGVYLCLDGRCRSCVSVAECVKEMNDPDSLCDHFRSREEFPEELRGRSCGEHIPGPPPDPNLKPPKLLSTPLPP
jgi:hypothetical protein